MKVCLPASKKANITMAQARAAVRKHLANKARRVSGDDDWDDDYLPYYETGQSYEIGGPVEPQRLRSVSPAAHAAIHHRPARSIGFHKSRTDR